MTKQQAITTLSAEAKRFYVLGFDYYADMVQRVVNFLETDFCEIETVFALFIFRDKFNEVKRFKSNYDQGVTNKNFEAYKLAVEIIEQYIDDVERGVRLP